MVLKTDIALEAIKAIKAIKVLKVLKVLKVHRDITTIMTRATIMPRSTMITTTASIILMINAHVMHTRTTAMHSMKLLSLRAQGQGSMPPRY